VARLELSSPTCCPLQPTHGHRVHFRTWSQRNPVAWQSGSQGMIRILLPLVLQCFGKAYKLRRPSLSPIATHCGQSHCYARTQCWNIFGATPQAKYEGDWQTHVGSCITTNRSTWLWRIANRASFFPRLLRRTRWTATADAEALPFPFQMTKSIRSKEEAVSKVCGRSGFMNRIR